MLRELPPRYFADATVPLGADGMPLKSTCISGPDYIIYLAWLADYLVATVFPVHPRQLAYVAVVDAQSPETAVFRISDVFGYSVWELESFDAHVTNGGTWEEWNQQEVEDWSQRDVDAWAGTAFDEVCLDRATFARIQEEAKEEQQLNMTAAHADIPYRSLLSRILHRVPEHERRVRILDSYFRNFSGNTAE